MIKIFALIFMLIDHVGKGLVRAFVLKHLLFKYSVQLYGLSTIMELIGRLSMSMFAYCIARGFYHYVKTGNMKKYFRNLAIFSVVSQVPFSIAYGQNSGSMFRKIRFFNFDCFNLNIGFTWFFAITLMFLTVQISNDFLLGKLNFWRIGLFVLAFLVVLFIPMDYDWLGMSQVIIFYVFCFRFKSSILLLVSNMVVLISYCCLRGIDVLNGFNGEIFSIFAVFLILYLQKFDDKLRLPKWLFYVFYPVHLAIIAGLNMMFIK